jgi:hypothetical protein
MELHPAISLPPFVSKQSLSKESLFSLVQKNDKMIRKAKAARFSPVGLAHAEQDKGNTKR